MGNFTDVIFCLQARFQTSAHPAKKSMVRCATISAHMGGSASELTAIKSARAGGVTTGCSATRVVLRISLDPNGKAANGKTGKMCVHALVVGTSAVRCATTSARVGTAPLVLVTIYARRAVLVLGMQMEWRHPAPKKSRYPRVSLK